MDMDRVCPPACTQEAAQIAFDTGPAGIRRGIEGAVAVASLAATYMQTGELEAPQTVLRKLFERLGSTYIKLGE